MSDTLDSSVGIGASLGFATGAGDPLDRLIALSAEPPERSEGSVTATDSLGELIARLDAELESVSGPGSSQEGAGTEATAQALGFTCGGRSYAVPLDQLLELAEVREITFVPGLDRPVRGLTNHRGEILPVVDLRRMLPAGTGARSGSERMLLVRRSDARGPGGALVDESLGFVRWNRDGDLSDEERAEEPLARFVRGRTVAGGLRMPVLDLAALVAEAVSIVAGGTR